MNDLLSVKQISNFQTILKEISGRGFVLRDVIDGGAGAGSASKKLIEFGSEDSTCFAFEPFPGNHRFFDGIDPRIKLIKSALGESNKKKVKFAVKSVVDQDSVWGRKGKTGYSSGGRLVGSRFIGRHIAVESIKADDFIPEDSNIDFIKLDLQGGELGALLGMTRILRKTPFLWVEFLGNKNLLEMLVDNGFHLFDSEYMFKGKPTEEVNSHFHITRENVTLSNGKTAYFGFRKTGWVDYYSEFLRFKKQQEMVQTDILCVKTEYLDLLHSSLVP